MVDEITLGKLLLGSVSAKMPPASQSSTIYGYAVSNSNEGWATINLNGSILEVETTCAVFEDDSVILTLVGTRPIITGVIARGDSEARRLSEVQTESRSSIASITESLQAAVAECVLQEDLDKTNSDIAFLQSFESEATSDLSKTKEKADGIAASLQEEISQREEVLRFVDEGIAVGREESVQTAHINNASLTFFDGETTKSRLSYKGLTTPEIQTSVGITIGGNYRFAEMNNGNLSLRYKGGV